MRLLKIDVTPTAYYTKTTRLLSIPFDQYLIAAVLPSKNYQVLNPISQKIHNSVLNVIKKFLERKMFPKITLYRSRHKLNYDILHLHAKKSFQFFHSKSKKIAIKKQRRKKKISRSSY